MLKIIHPLIALYIEQLKDPYGYENDGPLGLSIDRRSDFMYKYVHPTLKDWKTIKPIWDSTEQISNEDELALDAFNQVTFEEMHRLEVIARNVIVGLLEKGNNEIGRNL